MIEPTAHGFLGDELEVDGGWGLELAILPLLPSFMAADFTGRCSGECTWGDHDDFGWSDTRQLLD